MKSRGEGYRGKCFPTIMREAGRIGAVGFDGARRGFVRILSWRSQHEDSIEWA